MPKALKKREVAKIFGVGVDQLTNIHRANPIPGEFRTKGGHQRWWDSAELQRRGAEKIKAKSDSLARARRTRSYSPPTPAEIAREEVNSAKLFADIPWVTASSTGLDFSAVPNFAMDDILKAVGLRLQILDRARNGDTTAIAAIGHWLSASQHGGMIPKYANPSGCVASPR
jgi:hypothetical protein